jgi:O-antigen/teichoic acid export membrane protein
MASIFASGNMMVLALRLASTILTARLVEPKLLGVFNAALLAVPYAGVLQLGVLNGLNRELPYEIGCGNRSRAEELTAVAEAWALMVSTIAFLALMAIAVWNLLTGNLLGAAAFTAAAVSSVYLLYGQLYLQITYRTRGDFRKLAVILIVEALLNVFTLFLVWASPFFGLCVRSILLSFMIGAMLWKYRPLPLSPHWNRADIMHLFKVGAPIYGVGQLYALWPTLNATLIVARTSTSAFGIYSVALMVTASIGVMTNSMGQVVYPRMAEEYGRTHDAITALRPVFRATAIVAVVYLAMTTAGWNLLPLLIHAVLPKYSQGIQAAQWALVAGSLAVFALPFSFFAVVRRLVMYTFAVCGGMTAYIAAVLIFGHHPALDAFPKAMCIGYVVFLILSYLAMTRIISNKSSVV